MGKPTRLTRGAALLATLALVAGACTRSEPETREEVLDRNVTEPTGDRVDGGSVLVGHEHEPIVLNPLLVEGNLRSTAMATRPVLSGAYMITPDFRYVPDLLAGEAEPAGGDDEPFTVTWRIRDEAVWSDGTPVSADDFAFTHQTMLNEGWDIETVLRTGFEAITETEVVDAKTWRATFSGVFAPYRTMFETVLPAHVLEGQDFNAVWNEGIIDPQSGEPIASGPFLLDEWQRGDPLTLVRNPRFWGEPANLEQITFRYDEDVPSLLELLEAGDVDIYIPQQPLPAILDRLSAMEDLEVQAEAGPVWEHLAFNFSNELLAERHVREAAIQAIDREELVDALLADMNPDATVLQNPVYMENQDEYVPTFDRYTYDPKAAIKLLEDHGCTREDGKGVFTCDGQELEFDYLSTAGNEQRQQLFQMVRGYLADVGIALVDDLRPPAETLRRRLPDGDFDIVNFAWVGSPDPHRTGSMFACDGALNYTSYCNEGVDTLIETSTGILDEDGRAAAYSEAAELIAEDIALIPLFQLPEALGLSDRIGGVRLNPTQWGATWNASQWFLTE